MKKKELKKLKERAKILKRNSGRRANLPPNKVIPDQKKENNKKSARTSLDDQTYFALSYPPINFDDPTYFGGM